MSWFYEDWNVATNEFFYASAESVFNSVFGYFDPVSHEPWDGIMNVEALHRFLKSQNIAISDDEPQNIGEALDRIAEMYSDNYTSAMEAELAEAGLSLDTRNNIIVKDNISYDFQGYPCGDECFDWWDLGHDDSNDNFDYWEKLNCRFDEGIGGLYENAEKRADDLTIIEVSVNGMNRQDSEMDFVGGSESRGSVLKKLDETPARSEKAEEPAAGRKTKEMER